MNDRDYKMEQFSPISTVQVFINELCDGNLSESDSQKLNDLLMGSECSRWQYIHTIQLCEELKKWSRSRGTASASDVVEMLISALPDADLAQELSAAFQHEITGSKATIGGEHGGRTTVFWFTAACAAAILMLITLAAWQFRSSTMPTELVVESPRPLEDTGENLEAEYTLFESETVVARVASLTFDASWAPNKEPDDFLMRLRPGDVLGIDKGLAKIEFSEGAFVLMHAPAVLQINSGASAMLLNGRVVGRAENGNFVLTTPSATVVDIGTEFGIDVGTAGTDVTVFEGEVHVHGMLSDKGSSSMRRLRQGMSVRIDPSGLPHQLSSTDDSLYRRQIFQDDPSHLNDLQVSLLDLVIGHTSAQHRIAGSIDPATGYWGRPPWIDPETLGTQRGDTQFTRAEWNPMVDGVFIPRANAREMQIDSDGHMVYLPANSGSTWGPIWARRRSDVDLGRTFDTDDRHNHWGSGTLNAVRDRLQQARDGMMGLHANVGITFDLDAVRKTHSREIEYVEATIVNLASSPVQESTDSKPLADLRVFVDGRLRFSRLEFGSSDGEAQVIVPLTSEDRFLTIVTTDAGGDPSFDHVALIDPSLHLQPSSDSSLSSKVE